MTQTPHHGKNLRSIRLLQGMKQQYFASKLGVSQQYVSKLELRPSISKGILEKAASIFSVSIETILNFDENTLLILAAEARPEELTRSTKEMIDYFKEELLKKDRRIDSLEAEVKEYKAMSNRT